ncbi:MAG: hypoxanthine phosphoribosyltransferase [Cytophagales bacterium]|nr:MAG: hypoxanthine phosphoribosyltransferase [Cytophagales bacterium]
MKDYSIGDKTFELYISEAQIQHKIHDLAAQLDTDYAEKDLLIVGILNGSFRFVSDTIKQMSTPCEVEFVKVKSYEGLKSSGNVSVNFFLPAGDYSKKHILLMEDIIDTGHTIQYLIEQIKALNPASLSVATLFYKPEAVQIHLEEKAVAYICFKIENLFIVGYGLDYEGQGRTLNDVYVLKK